MRKLVVAVLAALVAAGAGVYLLAWRVDEAAFREKGWRADPEAAIRAGAEAGRLVLLKFGTHT